MRERPILFSASMVRAILSGHKTMTRRVIKGIPHGNHYGTDIMDWALSGCYTEKDGRHWLAVQSDVDGADTKEIFCPQGVVGDFLWVRETWKYFNWTEDGDPFIKYAADEKSILRKPSEEWSEKVVDIWSELSLSENYNIDQTAADRKWRPSIFMPRWASRTNLRITEVRVERLHDISEEDAMREGVPRNWFGTDYTEWSPDGDGYLEQYKDLPPEDEPYFCDAITAFKSLWDSINGKPRKDGVDISWAANPFVWAISFEVIKP